MYRVEITNAGSSLFNIKSKDYEFVIDTHIKNCPVHNTLKTNPYIAIEIGE